MHLFCPSTMPSCAIGAGGQHNTPRHSYDLAKHRALLVDLGIKGRRAVVIGASSGLGLTTCEALAAEGVDLVLFARDPKCLSAEADRLSRTCKIIAEGVAGNHTSQSDVKALAAHVRALGGRRYPRLQHTPAAEPHARFPRRDGRRAPGGCLRNQLVGALNVLREIPPILADRGRGRIVTSASVKQPMARHAVSTIFRAGVHAALKHLANELAARCHCERRCSCDHCHADLLLLPQFRGAHRGGAAQAGRVSARTRRHGRIAGVRERGLHYRADDPARRRPDRSLL